MLRNIVSTVKSELFNKYKALVGSRPHCSIRSVWIYLVNEVLSDSTPIVGRYPGRQAGSWRSIFDGVFVEGRLFA
jgi:hypothetical protein